MTEPKHPTIEYGEAHLHPNSIHTVLKTVGKYRVVHRTRGYQCAGSAMTWVEEAWGVLFDTPYRGGQWKGTLADAEKLFSAWNAQTND